MLMQTVAQYKWKDRAVSGLFPTDEQPRRPLLLHTGLSSLSQRSSEKKLSAGTVGVVASRFCQIGITAGAF